MTHDPSGCTKPSSALRKYLTKDGTTDAPDQLETSVMQNINILLAKISVKDGEKGAVSTSRRVRHLNDLAKVIRHVGPNAIDVKQNIIKIIENVRLALLSVAKEIRAGAMRVFRYLISSSEAFEIMLYFKIDYLVARSLDAVQLKDIERLQAMRFVLLVCPKLIPHSLVSPLISVVMSDKEPTDNLTWAALATLSEIALYNGKFVAESNIVKALVHGLLKCQMPEICESIILTLTSLLNHPQTRKYVRTHLDIESLLAPMTDLHFHYLVNDDMDPAHAKLDKEKRVESAKISLSALLQSWPGFMLLCSSSSQSGMSSVVQMLPLADSFIQKEILEVLYNVFQLKIPEWTTDYRAAIASIDPTQYCREWSLEEGWVAEEGRSLLPPKLMERVNLMDCYHALLLSSLLKVGLFISLVELIQVSELPLAIMAAILMGQLLHLANSILPPDCFSFSLTLPNLVSSAMLSNEHSKRNRAAEVINCLDRIHQMKKEFIKPSSLYLKLTLEQAGYLSGRTSNNTLMHVTTEMDDVTLQSQVRDTQVLTVREFVSWNWDLIFSLLQHPCLFTVPLTEDNIYVKFFRTLTNFYKPSSRQFSSIVYSNANSKRYSAVGLQLIKYLSKMEGSETGLLHGLVKDIVDQLAQVTVSKVTADVFSASSVSHKMARDYFLLLGAVSFHYTSLLQHCKAYGPLLDICSITGRHDLHKLIISSLHFAHDTHAQVILQKLLTGGDVETRLYATRHMRVFLRVNAPFFINWGMEMLIGQLYDIEPQIAEETIDILDEACEEESFLEALVLQHPALLHLSEKGVSLLTRFISVKRGYSLLSRLGHLKTELDAWLEDYNFRYVSVVEQQLAENLTSYRPTREGEYHRRSDYSNFKYLKAFVPVHFYGQLVRHDDGCELLHDEGHISKLLTMLKKEPITSQDIRQVKAAVWAFGHIGTSVSGLDLLLSQDVLHELITMVESSPVLSIRGTCFYSLCLISRTPQGADSLLSMGWTSVRHSSEEKWPLILEETIEDVATPSSPLSPSSSFGTGGSETTRLLTTRKTVPTWDACEKDENKSARSLSLMQKTPTAPSLTGGRTYVLRPVRPITLANNENKLSFASPDSPSKSRASHMLRHSSLSSIRLGSSGGFVGVALPLELNILFSIDDDKFEGSRASFVTTEIFNDDHKFLLEVNEQNPYVKVTDSENITNNETVVLPIEAENEKHDGSPLQPERALSKEGISEQEDEKEDTKVLATSVLSRTSVSSSTSGSIIFDEQSAEGRLLLHREFLEVVYYLCSDVSLRKNTLHLNLLCNKFPMLLQDIDLYWKTMKLLSIYNYSLTNRRLIQSKFENLTFDEVFTSTCQYYQTRERLRSDSDPLHNRGNSFGESAKKLSDDDLLLPLEETLETQSMRSMATTTTASELDTLSEGSLGSNDVLHWDLETEEVGKRDGQDFLTLAESGNRLSQLHVPPEELNAASVVEILYDI